MPRSLIAHSSAARIAGALEQRREPGRGGHGARLDARAEPADFAASARRTPARRTPRIAGEARTTAAAISRECVSETVSVRPAVRGPLGGRAVQTQARGPHRRSRPRPQPARREPPSALIAASLAAKRAARWRPGRRRAAAYSSSAGRKSRPARRGWRSSARSSRPISIRSIPGCAGPALSASLRGQGAITAAGASPEGSCRPSTMRPIERSSLIPPPATR